MDNMCARWSHDFKIYCDWPPSILQLAPVVKFQAAHFGGVDLEKFLVNLESSFTFTYHVLE